ncbi:MAG: hypothetical protein ACRDR6_19285 [Pseudonocardiaceae bacterium]
MLAPSAHHPDPPWSRSPCNADPQPPGHPGRWQKLSLGRSRAHTIVTVHVAEHTLTVEFPDGAQGTFTNPSAATKPTAPDPSCRGPTGGRNMT